MSLWAAPSGGLRLPSRGNGASVLDRLLSAPPYPGVSVVAPAIVPDPPLLDSNLPERSRVLRLCRVWSDVVLARCGVRRFIPGPKVVPSWRYYRQIANAAEALIAHSVWPAAWAAWTIDQWKRGGEKEPPFLTFVWAPGRIAKRAGWFGKECSGYLGGRAIFGERHRELLRRWNAMGEELLREGGTPARESRIVERWFPGKTYDELVREACEESLRKNAELRAQVEDGEWVWG